MIIAGGNHFEFEHSEFTDNHDFMTMAGVEDMRFHHNFVDNFNDDGFEPGPKRERGRLIIDHNYVSRCLSPFTAHAKKPLPVEGEPGSGLYIYRNVIDLRRGTYKSVPEKPDPSGAFLDEPTTIIEHDHGSPVHAVAYVYQNTFLMNEGPARGSFAFTWGSHTQGTTKRIFNNLFVQTGPMAELNFGTVKLDDDFQCDGNLYWSLNDGPGFKADLFAKLRASPLFAASKKHYPPGWSTHDQFADPGFVAIDADAKRPFDLHLRDGSAAIAAGIILPAEWPDSERPAAESRPDLGALPHGGAALMVGVRGRIDACTGELVTTSPAKR